MLSKKTKQKCEEHLSDCNSYDLLLLL